MLKNILSKCAVIPQMAKYSNSPHSTFGSMTMKGSSMLSPVSISPRVARLGSMQASQETETMERLVSTMMELRGFEKLSRLQIETGLQNIAHHWQSSPLHIAFVADRMFNAQGQFLEGDCYFNSHVYAHRQGRAGKFRGFENRSESAFEQPVYGAVNLSLRGHPGWGHSTIVLKPHLADHAELHSRDTGEQQGMGEFAKLGTYRHPFEIMEDWARVRSTEIMKTYFEALGRSERLPVDGRQISQNFPVEAAIYYPGGEIPLKEFAMLIIDITELEQAFPNSTELDRRLNEIQVFCQRKSIPLRFVEGPQIFSSIDGYCEIMNAYHRHHMA